MVCSQFYHDFLALIKWCDLWLSFWAYKPATWMLENQSASQTHFFCLQFTTTKTKIKRASQSHTDSVTIKKRTAMFSYSQDSVGFGRMCSVCSTTLTWCLVVCHSCNDQITMLMSGGKSASQSDWHWVEIGEERILSHPGKKASRPLRWMVGSVQSDV